MMLGLCHNSIPDYAVPAWSIPSLESISGTIESAICRILSAAATVTALIGGVRAPRIYPLGIPQGKTGAAVVYQQIDSSEVTSCDGPMGLRDERRQITCWSAQGGTPDAARTLAMAVYDVLSVVTGEYGAVTVRYFDKLDERAVESFGDNEQQDRYGIQQDWQVAYES